MRMKLMIALPLMMLGLQAYAQTGGTTNPPSADWCAKNPGKCGAVSQDLQSRCANNASGCEEFKQKMQAKCEGDPTKCAAVQNRMQANQATVQNYNSEHPNAAQTESNVGGRMANREGRRTDRRQKWRENHGDQSGSSTTPQQ